MSERLEKLQILLERQPNDPFLLYGMGLELKKLGRTDDALASLDKVTAVDPGYCYAHHQKGLIYEANGRLDEAIAAYRAGIDAAIRAGDAHAKDEIEAALAMIGD
jgi:tetratricopeptide (TPR) repeat protein